MAAPGIAAAAVAPVVVESARDDQGLVNQAFKITILIGLALAIGFTLYIIYRLFPTFSFLFDFFNTSIDAVNSVSSVGGLALTGILGGTVFGRGLFSLRLLSNRLREIA